METSSIQYGKGGSGIHKKKPWQPGADVQTGTELFLEEGAGGNPCSGEASSLCSWLNLHLWIEVDMASDSTRGKVGAPGNPAIQRSSGAFGGTVDGDVKIGLDIVDGNAGMSLQAKFDAAALVDSAFGSIDIVEPHHNARYRVAAMVQRVGQSLEDVVTQTVSHIKVVGVNLNLHLFSH